MNPRKKKVDYRYKIKSLIFRTTIKKIIFSIPLFSLVFFVLFIVGCSDDGMEEFNECLAENGMVIYGSEFCPACTELVEDLGGYEAAEPVYVECTEPENEQRCEEEKQTDVVPEVQLDGEVQDWPLDLYELGELTGCSLPE